MDLPAIEVMGGGVEAGNFLTHTSYTPASSCDEKLPANW
jgi:hypothetical protein